VKHVLCVSVDAYSRQPVAVKSCEISVTNISAADDTDKLTALFESERVTGVAGCQVDSIVFDTSESRRAVVKFTHQTGCMSTVA